MAKFMTFTVTKERLLRRDGPTVVVTVMDGEPGAVYADLPLEILTVAWHGTDLTKREYKATRALSIQSLPADIVAPLNSRKLHGWPALYGRFDVTDIASEEKPPFQMRTVMMSNQLALNALILHLVRKGQEFTCTPKCEGGEVTMTNYAWQEIAREFEDMVEGASHVVK